MGTQGSVMNMGFTREQILIRKAVVKKVWKGQQVTHVARMFRVSRKCV